MNLFTVVGARPRFITGFVVTGVELLVPKLSWLNGVITHDRLLGGKVAHVLAL